MIEEKKVLFCASTLSHIKNFHLPYIKWFHDNGYTVHVAAETVGTLPWVENVFIFPFEKKLLSLKNIFTIFKIRKFLKTQAYEIIITNTTLAGAIVRAAAIGLSNRPFIFHIVHGYLFNLEFSVKKHIYLFAEKMVSGVSDVIMVMNREDEIIARKYKLYRDKLFFINGMGVDGNRFAPVDGYGKSQAKQTLGFESKNIVFVYAAEFSKRKNQKSLVIAFSKIQNPNARLILAGNGELLEYCKELAAELGQTKRIRFAGYVKDMPALYAACDATVTTSMIEGLPFHVIESLACGIPVIASDIKGHQELVDNGENGYLFPLEDENALSKCMEAFCRLSPAETDKMRKSATEKATHYFLENVFDSITKIYENNWSV